MSKVSLENMEFHSFHGVLEHEKLLGNTFIVSVTMTMDTERAEMTDQLSDTLNYQLVYNAIKNEMENPSNLIEHVSRRILDALFLAFPQITDLKVHLSKLQPPLGAKVEKVSIELCKSR